jgi:hypothetical protein
MNIVYRSDGALHFVNGECCLTHAQAHLHTIVALEKALVHTAMTSSHTHSRNIENIEYEHFHRCACIRIEDYSMNTGLYIMYMRMHIICKYA